MVENHLIVLMLVSSMTIVLFPDQAKKFIVEKTNIIFNKTKSMFKNNKLSFMLIPHP